MRGVNMECGKGQMTCIMGRNGVGKTTLIKNIMGLEIPASGSIQMGNEELTSMPAHKRARRGIALVPQGRMIFPKLTVEENLRVGLEARDDGQRRLPDEIYELFPVLRSMSRRMGGDLSGGQQQQLAIARAMAGAPEVLLLDEPTEGIQPNIIQQIGEVLHKLIERNGVTVVMVEPYVDFVRRFGHHFYVMNRGQVVSGGPTDELSSEIVRRYLSL